MTFAIHPAANGVTTRYPPGHFYSPVVNPAAARKYLGPGRPFAERSIIEIPGIPIANSIMPEFREKAEDGIRATSLSEQETSAGRYD